MAVGHDEVVGSTAMVDGIVGCDFFAVPSYVASRDDLFQAGMEGVCQAAQRWHEGDVPFGAFARLRAKGAIRDFLRQIRPGTRHHPEPPPASLDRVWVNDADARFTLHDLIAAPDAEPEDHVWLACLFDAVDGLPGLYSRTFRLYYEAELTMQEIGDMDGVSESAISLRLVKARRLLRPRFRELLA